MVLVISQNVSRLSRPYEYMWNGVEIGGKVWGAAFVLQLNRFYF